VSDIAIRFDGLILMLALATGAAIYAAIAVAASAVSLVRPRPRGWLIARRSASMAGAAFAVAVGVGYLWDRHGFWRAADEWIDYLTYPWIVLFVIGCWWLFHQRRNTAAHGRYPPTPTS